MFLSNLRSFPVLVCLSLLLMQACGSAPKAVNADLSSIGRGGSGFPFAISEPKAFNCRIVQTTGSTTAEYFIARDGDSYRFDIVHGEGGRMSQVKAGGKEYLVSYKQHSFYEMPANGSEVTPTGSIDAMFRGMIPEGGELRYEKVSAESGRTRYAAASADGKSEAVIETDDATGLPVSHEFFGIEGGTRRLIFSIKLEDVKLDAPAELFALPEGFVRSAKPPDR